MGAIEDRMAEMEIALPSALVIPPDIKLPFAFVNVRGDRAIVSGHGPQNDDGTTAGPFGIVGADLFGLPVEIEAEVLIST